MQVESGHVLMQTGHKLESAESLLLQPCPVKHDYLLSLLPQGYILPESTLRHRTPPLDQLMHGFEAKAPDTHVHV